MYRILSKEINELKKSSNTFCGLFSLRRQGGENYKKQFTANNINIPSKSQWFKRGPKAHSDSAYPLVTHQIAIDL